MQTTNTILSPRQAVEAFVDIRGDEGMDADDITEIVDDIGNPDANFPVTRTTETVADFEGNGWEPVTVKDQPAGIVSLRKQVGTHRTARGMAPRWTFANIADCGDYRLVYVERL